MKRFKTDVKLFVLDERSEGKGWKMIKERIRQKFNVEPPTTRAMQKWEKTLDRSALNAELMKDARAQLPALGAEAQVRFAQDLLPVLWKARDAGQDMELAGWKWFLYFIDHWVGSPAFERLISEYMRERQE